MGVNNERIGAARHIARVLAGEDALEILERMTGRTLKQYEQKWSQNLLQDVERGLLNPDAVFTLNKIQSITRRYGLDDDDLVFINVDTSLIVEFNRGYAPKQKNGHIAQEQVAFKLNPEKFAALSNMYRGKAA